MSVQSDPEVMGHFNRNMVRKLPNNHPFAVIGGLAVTKCAKNKYTSYTLHNPNSYFLAIVQSTVHNSYWKPIKFYLTHT